MEKISSWLFHILEITSDNINVLQYFFPKPTPENKIHHRTQI